MDYKYLFQFYNADHVLCDWYCFDPKEPISDAIAVHEAFNMLISRDDFESVVIYQDGKHFESSGGRLLVCVIDLH